MGPLKYAMWGFLLLAAFTLYFFRDPPRTPLTGKGRILSAADGRVMAIQAVEEGMRISVFLSLFDVHVNRIPISGRVEEVKHIRGRFSLAFRSKASDRNEHTRVVIAQGTHRVIIRQIAGKVARRIVCTLKEGDRVEQGKRFGMIRFGSRVDLIVPSYTVLQVKLGDRVKAAQSTIGVIHEAAS
jgi:phosphatidylserine decarboxylase